MRVNYFFYNLQRFQFAIKRKGLVRIYLKKDANVSTIEEKQGSFAQRMLRMLCPACSSELLE